MLGCPECYYWNVETIGVNERGEYKYVCRKYYHHYTMPAQLHKALTEGINRAADELRKAIDRDILKKLLKSCRSLKQNSKFNRKEIFNVRKIRKRNRKNKYSKSGR